MTIPAHTIKQYSLKEEIANSIIHGFGIVFGVVGLTILLVLSCLYGTTDHVICYSIYGASVILLYTSSTLYHALPHLKAKQFFKVCDHCSIFLLIAGTYTPFLALNLKGAWGWSLMAVIWGLALGGIVFKVFFTGKFKYLSTLVYLGMGWLIVVAAEPLRQSVSPEAITLIGTGGGAYTFGTIFYLLKRMPFSHTIWHLFVLAGSVCHFAAILHASNFSFT